MALTMSGFLTFFLVWEGIYWVVRRLLCTPAAVRRLTPVVRRDAPAYVVSTLHALFAASRGARHIARLWRAPPVLKNVIPVGDWLTRDMFPYIPEAKSVIMTNISLAAYLTSDLAHVIIQYPKLGGMDTVAHHLAFLVCALVAGSGDLFPFMFSWLIVGEASTPLLNIRWFLIRQGLGDTSAMKHISLAFALVFFLTRFCIYGSGLAHQMTIYRHLPTYINRLTTGTVMLFVAAGFVLNLIWLTKITRVAAAPTKPKARMAATHAAPEGSTIAALPNDKVKVT